MREDAFLSLPRLTLGKRSLFGDQVWGRLVMIAIGDHLERPALKLKVRAYSAGLLAPQKSKEGSYLLTDTLFTLPRLTLRREQAPALQGCRYASDNHSPDARGMICSRREGRPLPYGVRRTSAPRSPGASAAMAWRDPDLQLCLPLPKNCLRNSSSFGRKLLYAPLFVRPLNERLQSPNAHGKPYCA